MKLGVENRTQKIAALVLGGLLVAILIYQLMPTSSTIASTTPALTTGPQGTAPPSARNAPRRSHGAAAAKKVPAPQSLDPTLRLDQLAASEQIMYEGSGRNIFIAGAEPVIPALQGNGTTDHKKDPAFVIPAVTPPPAIPLKFFGFANQPGEARKIFLSKGDDVFIAGEGEIVDRRYKVLRISPSSVEIQDVVGSGPPQTIPLTQG